MKTRNIISILVTLFLSINMYAANPVIHKNESITDYGRELEITVYKEDSQVLDKRVVSKYDLENKILEKITYKWVSYEGWKPEMKREYTYSDINTLECIQDTKWDARAKDWSKDIKLASYNTQGQLEQYAQVKTK